MAVQTLLATLYQWVTYLYMYDLWRPLTTHHSICYRPIPNNCYLWSMVARLLSITDCPSWINVGLWAVAVGCLGSACGSDRRSDSW